MKIKYMCKLVLEDEFDNVAMEDVHSADVIAESLIEDLKTSLSPRGKVTIEDPYLNIER